ncbi:saccharopine dehydrogenase [Sesbania bispinosa]|nr:saccharopine dehydrogenase [Sesbania bispinosa]
MVESNSLKFTILERGTKRSPLPISNLRWRERRSSSERNQRRMRRWRVRLRMKSLEGRG